MAAFHIRPKLIASGVHLVFSCLLACVVAALVFGVWYPAPYSQLSGATTLFLMVVGVDVVLGPLITFIVFNASKTKAKLVGDLIVVAAVQLVALGYGAWTVFAARPVHLVFEYDRMRVVHAAEIPENFLSLVPAGIDAQPLRGPTLLALRPFKDNAEQTAATFGALAGIVLSTRPELWMPYDKAVPEVLKAAKPVSQLISKTPAFAAPVQRALAQAQRSEADTVYLPLASRSSFGTVLLDAKTGQPVALLPLDSF